MTLPVLQAPPTGDTYVLTADHRYRGKALAVDGAYYSHERKAYAVDNPSPRAAAAIMALFPEVLVDHPELAEIRTRGYGDARPYDYASELQIRLEVGTLGDKELYGWQDIDAGYLNAILARDGGIHVGWDRGLGKTIITAAFIRKTEATRSLIVARNDAKVSVWQHQLMGWDVEKQEYDPDKALLPADEYQVLVLPNEKTKRERFLDSIEREWSWRQRSGGGQPGIQKLVLIVHYEAIKLLAGDKVVEHRDRETGEVTGTDVTKGGGHGWDRLGDWDLMSWDESHRLASYNPNSSKNTQMGRALSYLRRKHVAGAINLSGSGIMNRPDDLFGQLHFILPKIYKAKWRDWNDRYVDYVDDGVRKVPIGFKLDKLDELRRELGVFMVYRKKAEVFQDMPPLIIQDVELDMLPEQRRVYNEVRDQFWSKLDQGGVKAVNVLDQLNKLRRIATYYPGVPSAKLDWAYNEIMEEPDLQWAVFTWYKDPGRRLAEMLGDEAVVVDGDVHSMKRRQELLDRHASGKARVLIGSIAVLGESLNLQYMHEAIRLDRHWNPEANGQTNDRLYRHGQEARVTMRDLWTKGTVDLLRLKPNLMSKESLRKAVFG